ncbi:thioesterase II family protein [Streptomyces sp. NPDC088560]|uniref:thioesterase II family protein n=1 Tax=Streptomyces sp. NPDC088560 TaxID=3365868 RepID=UPI00381CACC6
MNDTVVVRPNRSAHARQDLVCLPFCGGGAGAYMGWASAMPPGTDLAAVCYPGRDGRYMEEYAHDWDALAEDAIAALTSLTERPYVLFGHSLGGLLAFDVTVRLRKRGAPAPRSLVLSAVGAPRPGLSARDMFPGTPWVESSDEELVEWMQTFGILPDYALDDSELKDMAVEIMRADLRVRDSYECSEEVTIDLPVLLLTGEEDTVIPPDAGQQWKKVAVGEFQHDLLPGAHFYTPDVWSSLPSRMASLGS